MARSRPVAHEALKRLREQRAQLDEDEKRLRKQAADDLAQVLLDCGAELHDPTRFRQLIRLVMEYGIDASLTRLGGKP
ncbi:DUF6437 family protein [Novosphingobium percolationis]|uniref:DUF6437 family protein n=1 Tax=Novosphingobium percolationis TaxID=2871811 RepID=UPI001CD3468D|nr:DUF6437 family protein [Novosphingobium percolationis]